MLIDIERKLTEKPKSNAAPQTEESETINWLADFISLNRLFPKVSDSKVGELLRMLWPFAKDHVGPALPCFLMTGPAAGWLMKRQQVLCRDGALPLLNYSYDHPTPPPCKVLVAEELLPLLPEAWRPRTRGFRYVCRTVFTEQKRPKKLILTGLVHDLFASTATLKSTLESLTSLWGPQFYQDIEILTQFRFVPKIGLKTMDESEWWEFSRILESTLHGQHRVLKSEELLNLSIDDTVAYCEVNSRLLVSDSYLTHFFLSKGAGLIGDPTKALMQDSDLAFSHYHGVSVTENDAIATRPRPTTHELTALKSVATLVAGDCQAPWQDWMELWMMHEPIIWSR